MKHVKEKVFSCRELHEALALSKSGGLAVHLHSIIFPDSPNCFKRDVNQGLPIAHVFCLNADRLRRLAKELGVRVVFIDRENTDSQHLDLCGVPLKKLLANMGHDVEGFREKEQA